MPAPTDHILRRVELADHAIDLIAEEGLEAVTIRRLAAVTGFSTTVVTHYFPNKQALLFKVYERCAERAQERVDQAFAKDPGDVGKCLEALLAIGEEARKGWKVNIAFWPHALKDGPLRERQLWWTRKAEQTVTSAIQRAYPLRDAEAIARGLLSALIGIAVRSSFDASWDDEMQKAALQAALRSHLSIN